MRSGWRARGAYTGRMTLRRHALILIALMFWQALSWVVPVTVQEQAQRFAHLVMHEEVVDHHHHHDESIHVQDVGTEAAHFHADGGSQPVGLAADKAPSLLPVTASLPPTVVCWPPSVCLDGLLRPPQAAA